MSNIIDIIESCRTLAHKAYDAGQYVTAFEALKLGIDAAVAAGSFTMTNKIIEDIKWMQAGLK
jgi:hypothetical protein